MKFNYFVITICFNQRKMNQNQKTKNMSIYFQMKVLIVKKYF